MQELIFACWKFDVKLAAGYSDNTRKIICSRKFENNAKGFKEFWVWITSRYKEKGVEIRISCEATAVYDEHCASICTSRDIMLLKQ
jgi:hypothetical protein